MGEIYIPYPLVSPRMNKSTSSLRVNPGTLYELSGVDGRFSGGLKKFWGMKELTDLDDITGAGNIDAYDGPSYFKAVTFQKKDTSTTYRGFVIRWDVHNNNSSEQIDLFYTADNGSSWAKHNIWAARTIAFTSGGTAEVTVGMTVTGATSGATAKIDSVILSSGSWAGGTAAGTFNIHTQTGTFQAENLNVTGTQDNIATVAGNSTDNAITSTLAVDCMTEGGFLIVAVDTKATKTVYWSGSALTTVSSGPGDFGVELGAMTLNTTAVDSSYQLRGDGSYQVAYRFYDSTRGIYSGLSDILIIHLDHMKESYATGAIYFSSGGGDSGLMVAGDVFTINSRTYEYIDAGSNVTIAAAGAATIAAHATALANAINGDSSASVTAVAGTTAVTLTAKTRGASGNAYGLSDTEVAPNQNDISVSGSTLAGGGTATTDPETQCKATIDFPANGSVVSGKVYADFAALFDTVDVFRTINLGDAPADGAIFYLEQTVAKTGNWATSGTWDALTVTIGTMVDEALPFQTMYDPEKDIVSAPPQSGAIGRYQSQTFMTEATGTRGGYDIVHSSFETSSPEYFTTYNRWFGNSENGRPQRFIRAGDSMFALCPNAVVHIFKPADWKPIEVTELHQGRGLSGPGAAHAAGNSIFMVSPAGLMILNAADGSMGQVSAVDRVIFSDWKADLPDVKSAYDAGLNASIFLNPDDSEAVIVWHSQQTASMLEGANFVGVSDTADITDGTKRRAYFITTTGLIVYPDTAEAGYGNMWGLSSSYTLDGTTTGAASQTSIIDSGATFHADMVGALLYCTSGDNAGECREITNVNVGTKTITVSAFTNNVATGDRYSISPVPFKVRLWPLRANRQVSAFDRWVMTGAQVKVNGISGFTGNDNAYWRLAAYRNSGTSLDSEGVYIDVTENPPDSAGALGIDGVDVEPYLEQIACGVKFELIDMHVGISETGSKNVVANS